MKSSNSQTFSYLNNWTLLLLIFPLHIYLICIQTISRHLIKNRLMDRNDQQLKWKIQLRRTKRYQTMGKRKLFFDFSISSVFYHCTLKIFECFFYFFFTPKIKNRSNSPHFQFQIFDLFLVDSTSCWARFAIISATC